MKYFPKLKLYKAANVTFNPETREAHSYSWWRFTAMIDGKLVFNDYHYSNTTRKHQCKVRALLSDLGLTIDHVVNVRESLVSCQGGDTIQGLLDRTQNTITAKELEKKRKAKEYREKRKAKSANVSPNNVSKPRLTLVYSVAV
jgi:hypothetical protein